MEGPPGPQKKSGGKLFVRPDWQTNWGGDDTIEATSDQRKTNSEEELVVLYFVGAVKPRRTPNVNSTEAAAKKSLRGNNQEKKRKERVSTEYSITKGEKRRWALDSMKKVGMKG